ncbi:MAG: dephospho-CoA kinase [Porticoccaceae bacterium]|nr:dephospho-CoA kinase [Porticoccaceae bacterium]
MTEQRLRVGLTGGIGSGKSTVAKAFIDLGVKVVDADQGSRAVVKPKSKALESIRNHFKDKDIGEAILLADGQLNRPLLREIVFSDPAQKRWLEQLLHPLIRDWIVSELQKTETSPYVILESPLLLETDQQQLVDGLLLIDVPTELQRQRASLRDGGSAEEIQSIMDTQMEREQRRQRADWIFDNSQSIDSIAPRVQELHQYFLNRARS